MKKNLYSSNDEDHQHVINLLRELPREKAPENFEYNLRIKIENRNFSLNTDKQKSIIPSWKILIPATGTLAAAILVFSLSFNEPEIFENPFDVVPEQRLNFINNASDPSSAGISEDSKVVNENDVLISEDFISLNKRILDKSGSNMNARIVEPNVKPDFPFNNESSTNLDELLSQRKKTSTVENKASLAGRTNSESFFNGFFIREEVDKEYVDKLKARMDSLRNAQKTKKKKMNIVN